MVSGSATAAPSGTATGGCARPTWPTGSGAAPSRPDRRHRPGPGLRPEHPRDPACRSHARADRVGAAAVRAGRRARHRRAVRLRRDPRRRVHRAHQARPGQRRAARRHVLPAVGPRPAPGGRRDRYGDPHHQDPGPGRPDDARLRAHRTVRRADRPAGDVQHGTGAGRGGGALPLERGASDAGRGHAARRGRGGEGGGGGVRGSTSSRVIRTPSTPTTRAPPWSSTSSGTRGWTSAPTPRSRPRWNAGRSTRWRGRCAGGRSTTARRSSPASTRASCRAATGTATPPSPGR